MPLVPLLVHYLVLTGLACLCWFPTVVTVPGTADGLQYLRRYLMTTTERI